MRAAGIRGQRGFTLLEAIVALVIMATSLVALYAWLGSATIGLQRASAQVRSVEDAREALAVVNVVNPQDEPQGEREAGPLRVRWTSERIDGPRPGLSATGLPTQFDFSLYLLKVDVSRDGRPVRSFEVRKAAWSDARPIRLEDM